MESQPQAQKDRAGLTYGISAYVWWGLVPIYYRVVSEVPALEILAHRTLWSLIVTGVLLMAGRQLQVVFEAWRDRRVVKSLLLSTLLLSFNWFTFTWAMYTERVLEASLGYFINPLVNVLLGRLFLGERLRPGQSISVGLATVGVVYLTIRSSQGQFPWVALVLAFTFGFYGLLRKTARLGSLQGLTLETALMTIVGIAYLIFLHAQGAGHFGSTSRSLDLLIALSGIVTAVPLLLFAAAARRVSMATLGFMQYIAPSGQFLLAVLAFGEPFTRDHVVTFVCIWTALAIYTYDAYRARPRK